MWGGEDIWGIAWFSGEIELGGWGLKDFGGSHGFQGGQKGISRL